MPCNNDIGDSTPGIKMEENFKFSDVTFDDIHFHPEQNRVYVYTIVCIGTPFLKIGLSSNPRKRVLSMQTGNPMPLKLAAARGFSSSEIAFQVEARMHFLLGTLNETGEWFRASLPYVQDAMEKAAKQVRNKRGELSWQREKRCKVNLDWEYSE